MSRLRVLCINPWIYDFTAYDLWSKPLGLLYIASWLRSRGLEVELLDCLDKWHPDLLARQRRSRPRLRRYGTGHFHREIVSKPDCLHFVPRHFARYGLPEDIFLQDLRRRQQPDVILLTSGMTYWYPGPQRVSELCRRTFPGVPIVLGGIYASLMPHHAQRVVKPDYLVSGPGEFKISEILDGMFDVPELLHDFPARLDDFPWPAFDLVRKNDYLIVMTSRGCPFRCTFCATYNIERTYTQRQPALVVEEILAQTSRFGVHDVAFYDDALLLQADRHFKPILRELLASKCRLNLHAPNGLHGRYLDEELAELMFRSGFKTIRISLESVAAERRRDIHNKITPDEMSHAVQNLIKVGFKAEELETYVIMGLPGQPLEEVIDTILYARQMGVRVRLASFSPIPSTRDYDRAVENGHFPPNADPLLTNKTIVPLHRTRSAYDLYQRVSLFAKNLNDGMPESQIKQEMRLLLDLHADEVAAKEQFPVLQPV